MSKSRTTWIITTILLLSLLLLTAGCIPTEGEGEEGGSGFPTMIIFIGLMFAVMYFLMIRPQQKKQRQQKELVEELRKGDNVITNSGIFGKIERIGKESVVLQIESGATIRVTKESVAGKITQ